MEAFDRIRLSGKNNQEVDFFRYAVVYLYGGLACDLDVWARPGIVDLLAENKDKLLLLFEESHRVGSTLGRLAILLGLTEMPRYPQYRAGIFAAIAGHSALLGALNLVVERVMAEKSYVYRQEPLQSLTMTGPGLFTDAVAAWASPEMGTVTVSRWTSMREHYGHGGMGTWKAYKSSEQSNMLALLGFICGVTAAWRGRNRLASVLLGWWRSAVVAMGGGASQRQAHVLVAMALLLFADRFIRVPYGMIPFNLLTQTPPHEHPTRPCGWDYEANWTIHLVEGGPLAVMPGVGHGGGTQPRSEALVLLNRK